jgi:hypothetical protein
MMTSNINVDSYLGSVRTYVALQRKLIESLRLDSDVNEVTFSSKLPREVAVDNTKWKVSAHGVGVRFTSSSAVVDAHKGFIEAPNAFDAWRLCTYYDSKGLQPTERKDWESLLLALCEEGFIQHDETSDSLFVLSETAGQAK